MRKLVFCGLLAAVFMLATGCVSAWDYYELRENYDALLKIQKSLDEATKELGPENDALKKELATLKAENEILNKKLKAMGQLVSSGWEKVRNQFLESARQIPVDKTESDEGGITVYKDSGTLGIQQELLFASGSVKVKPGAKRVIRNLADLLTRPEYRNAIIQVEGHTDRQPVRVHKQFENNWKLSALRAYAVLQELIKAGVPESRICGVFWGEHKNRAYNPPGAAKAENRRVEIRLVEK